MTDHFAGPQADPTPSSAPTADPEAPTASAASTAAHSTGGRDGRRHLRLATGAPEHDGASAFEQRDREHDEQLEREALHGRGVLRAAAV